MNEKWNQLIGTIRNLTEICQSKEMSQVYR
jgi:hypothetical protein